VGNDQIGNSADRFFYMSEVDMNRTTFGATFGELYGYTRSGISVSRYANPLITWEKSKQLNLGVDVRLLNALDINVDVYKYVRSNLLTARTYIPSTMGLQAAVQANTNKGESKGLDFSASYNKSFGRDWYVQTRSNFTYATSKILINDEPSFEDNEYYRTKVGQPMDRNFGYIAERLFIDDNEAKNSPVQFSGTPGINYGGGD